MKSERIFSKNKVCPENEMDSVKRSKQLGERRAFNVLMEAQMHWSNMDRFRKDRERNKRYCYGDQWRDIITVDGETMTEEEYISSQGNVPLKNNLIRRLVRNVLGVYRSQATEPTCTARDRDEQRVSETMSTILQSNMSINRRKELDARTMEEFLIGGLIVHKKWYGWRNDKLDCWTDYVHPNNFFVDANMRDFRGWDCSCIGEVHDVSFQTLVQQFASGPEDYRRLKEIYHEAHDKNHIMMTCDQFGYSRLQNYDFLFTSDPTRCRVIEVWRKEAKPRYRCHDYNSGDVYKIEIEDYEEMVVRKNADRIARGVSAGMLEDDIPLVKAEWFIDDYWYYYYLTPFGQILKEGETPYDHKSHPYVFKAYPMIDGEVHSFVSDVIDQQRYTNRLITLYDWIMRASAKGVLLFPEECLPAGMSLEDVADEWSRYNGVIAIKAKAGVPLPQQISSNATNIGIGELLNIQLKFFEDISGVHGALQGKTANSSTSGTLYNQQAQNATMSLLDLLDSFSTFIIDSAYKDVKNMQQFYDTKRKFKIVGKSAYVEYDPKVINDIEFDLSIVESTATPAYRAIANQFLFDMWKAGAITIEMLLEHGNFPFGDELLQSIQSQQEKIQAGESPGQIPAQLQEQIAQQGQADPRANQMIQQFMGERYGNEMLTA